MHFLKYISLLLAASSFAVIHAQPSSFEKELNAATKNIYVNPTATIATGDSMLALDWLSDEQRIKTLLMLVNGSNALRSYEKALDYAKTAEGLINETTMIKLGISIFQATGSQYHALKMYDQAIVYFDKAEAMLPKLENRETAIFSSGYNNISKALIYRDQIGCDVAVEYFEKAIADYTSIYEIPAGRKNLSTAFYNKGNCEYNLNQLDGAEKSYRSAIQIAIESEAWSLAAFAQKGLAILLTTKGEFGTSLELLESALNNTQKLSDPLLEQSILKAISDNYLGLGDLDKFQEYSSKTSQIQAGIILNHRSSLARSLDELASEHYQTSQSVARNHWFWLIAQAFFIIAIGLVLFTGLKKSNRASSALKEKIAVLKAA